MERLNKEWAKIVEPGILAYLAFMFGFNALSLVLNELFLAYVAVFSLSIFGIAFRYSEVRQSGNLGRTNIGIKLSAIILILFAVSVYTIWLSEIITSMIHESVPESIAGMNLPSSVTHVFDMAFALPLILIGSILLLRGNKNGLIISLGASVFVFLICISLLGMEYSLKIKGLAYDEGQLFSMYIMVPLSILPPVVLMREVTKRS